MSLDSGLALVCFKVPLHGKYTMNMPRLPNADVVWSTTCYYKPLNIKWLNAPAE